MLAGNLSFLEQPEHAAMFYWGLAVQYLRTNHIKGTKLAMPPERVAYYFKLANVLVHILAKNLGLNMYSRREQYTIVLLDNPTEVPLVTADQPVINIAGNPRDSNPVQRFEVYYPLSPRRALLILEPSSEFLPATSTMSAVVAHLYNLRMAAYSYQQVFSDSPNELKAITMELPAFLSCL